MDVDSAIEPTTMSTIIEKEFNPWFPYIFDYKHKFEVEPEPPIPEVSKLQTCVVGISTNKPYDSSKFVNNEAIFYRQITYSQLEELSGFIMDIANSSSATCNTSVSRSRSGPGPMLNQNIIFITECYKLPEIKMIFRFLCSPDCNEGNEFIDTTTNDLVYKFLNIVCDRQECLIEFSDHSLGSFVANWNNDIMSGLSCPIKIKSYTHSGYFKMYGKKLNFKNSAHPTLKQIGELAENDDIEITFNNMGGTKAYEILNNDIVRLISTGNQLKSDFMHNIDDNPKIYEIVPVHCEFNYKNGIIILSSTHWCNLNLVESSVNIQILREYCTDSFGMQAT